MPNMYFVVTVGGEQVVGLAVGEGDKFISTCYADSGKEGPTAPTTIADLRASVDSGAIPVPPAGIVDVIGLDSATTIHLLTEAVGEDVYLEHAMVA